MLSRPDIQLHSQTVCHGKHANIHGENHYSDGFQLNNPTVSLP